MCSIHGFSLRPLIGLSALTCLLFSSGNLLAVDSKQIEKLFAQPSRDYATAPLWVWNDMQYAGELLPTAYEKGQIKNNPEALQQAFNWGRKLVK